MCRSQRHDARQGVAVATARRRADDHRGECEKGSDAQPDLDTVVDVGTGLFCATQSRSRAVANAGRQIWLLGLSSSLALKWSYTDQIAASVGEPLMRLMTQDRMRVPRRQSMTNAAPSSDDPRLTTFFVVAATPCKRRLVLGAPIVVAIR